MLGRLSCVALIGCLSLSLAHGIDLRSVYKNRPLKSDGGDPGQPLFLTPLIQEGQIELAKNLSSVGPLDGDNIPSFSGYFTVNSTYDSNLFFWFFPALENPESAPVVLWLQGGPGGSSLFGLFVEQGPYIITKDQTAKLRNSTWAGKFNMIYIDNPVGTGFSFTKSDAGYATNEVDVGRDLYQALQQFFTLFSEYAKNDFYITGESYAGKYVPAAAYYIYKQGTEAKMNLKGIAIGDGLCDPITMLDYADFLQQIGLLDDAQTTRLKAKQAKAKAFLDQKDYMNAYYMFNEFMSDFHTATHLDFYYNFLLTEEPASFEYYNNFVQTSKTRKAIHVGNLEYNDGGIVQQKLEMDFMQSVKPWIAELMQNYKVMIYNGQLDVIIAAPLTANFVSSIPWDGANDLKSTDRIIWHNKETGYPAGYVRQVKQFTEVLVRNAGHILPYDQPDNAFDMIDRFINDKPFN